MKKSWLAPENGTEVVLAEMSGNELEAAQHFLAAAHLELVLAADYDHEIDEVLRTLTPRAVESKAIASVAAMAAPAT